MDPLLACGHDSSAYGPRICPHLLAEPPEKEGYHSYFQWFTGHGGDNELLCQDCFKTREAGESAAAHPVCRACFKELLASAVVREIRVPAGIRERQAPFAGALVSTPLPPEAGKVDDFTSIDGESTSVWLLLNREGEIFRYDAESGVCKLLAKVDVPFEAKEWKGRARQRRLHVGRKLDFAAVVVDYAIHGKIVDLRSGEVILDLEHPDYCAHTVPFPFAFAETAGGETLAIYRSDWNRLDLRNLDQRALLSDRETRFDQNDPNRPHFLDYFHGRLHASPDGDWILDGGWIWHPVGIPRVWSVSAWLSNVHESEDGPSSRELWWRENHWDLGMTFVGNDRVAVSGLGDEAWAAGVSIFDLTLPHPEHRWDSPAMKELPGPTGEFFSDGEALYSTGPGGLSRWNLEDGCRTGHIPGFEPTRHHLGAGELAQLRDGVLFRWRMPEPTSGKP